MGVKTDAFNAAGTTLGYKLTSGAASFVDLAMIRDMELGGTTIAKLETTKLASTVKTSLPSIPDNGDVTFSVYYVPADPGVAELTSLAQSPLVIYWQIQLPDGTSPTTGTTLTFTAWLNSFAPKGFAIDDKPVADVGITITGGVVTTVGT